MYLARLNTYKNHNTIRKYVPKKHITYKYHHNTMGSNLSKDITPPPLTLQDCLVNGNISLSRYYYYRKYYDNYSEAIEREDTHWNKKRKRSIVVEEPKVINKRQRSVKRHKLMVRNEDGSLRERRPVDTLWCLLYVSNPPTSERMSKLF